MRVVPERSPWLQIATVFGGFLIGPLAALRLSQALVPESDLLQTASTFGFALVFVGGTLLWTGIGLVTVVVGGLWNLLRGRVPGPKGLRSCDRIVPPGYRAFIVLGVAFGLVLGLLAGLATAFSVPAAVAIWTAAGLAYGVVLWMAAHHGYLPFLEPE